MSIFICYSSADRSFVRFLRRMLFEAGVRIWMDEAEIKVGDSLVEKIQDGIADVEYVGAVLSQNSVASPWVKEELNSAMNRQISGKPLKVLPILIQDCTIPPFLAHRKYADFRDPEKAVGGLTELLDVLLGGQLSHLVMFGDIGQTGAATQRGMKRRAETIEPFDLPKGKVLCRDCRFHVYERDPELADTSGIVFSGTVSEKRQFLETIWYNQLCRHQAGVEEELDYSTGLRTRRQKHCRDMNPTGDCDLYELNEG